MRNVPQITRYSNSSFRKTSTRAYSTPTCMQSSQRYKSRDVAEKPRDATADSIDMECALCRQLFFDTVSGI